MILECFEYNQHFVAMMNIINHAKLFNKEGKFEKHHIIPKCFYKKKGLEVDNSSSNLVQLTLEEHRKVHQLAYLCAKDIVKTSLLYAKCLMNREKLIGRKHSEETKTKTSVSMKKYYENEENRKRNSETKLGKPHPHKAGFQSDEKRRKISEAVRGRKLSAIGKTIWNKGKHWKLINGKRTYY